MKRSTGRILTTHVGSLVRPPQLLKFIGAKQTGQAYDERAYAECLRASFRSGSTAFGRALAARARGLALVRGLR